MCAPRHGSGDSVVGILKLGFCVGRLVRNDVVDAPAVDPLGLKCETELLAHDAREEATHRVLLPAGSFHDPSNSCSLGLAQQRDHSGLFGIRTRCDGAHRCRPTCFFRRALGGRARSTFLARLVAWHVGILSSVNDGISCRHHRNPAAGPQPAGLDPERGHRRLVELTHTTALLAPKGQSFLDNLIACFPASRSWNDHVRTEGNLLRCMSPLLGVKRTWRLHCEMSAFDPKRTFGLSLNGLRLDGYDALSKALGASNETARVHRHTRRCCDRVVARRERPGETRNWFPQQRISRCLPGSHHSVSSRFATARLY